MLIYPAIDLRAGECVRLLHGRFDAVTRYDADPFARLQAFVDAGAEWVHVVDLDGAEAGSPRQHALIGDLARATGAKIQTGGGVRERADVERLLEAGAARVVVGSAAVKRPDEVRAWIAAFGLDRICAALDVKTDGPEPEVATHGWTRGSGLTLAAARDLYPEGSLRHVLITDVSRDGALTGPNVELLADVIRRRPDLAVQASGGVATLADLPALASIGAAGAIVGRALYEGRFTLEQALVDPRLPRSGAAACGGGGGRSPERTREGAHPVDAGRNAPPPSAAPEGASATSPASPSARMGGETS